MKDKNAAGLLGIFFGAFGAHKFYLGEPGPGCVYLAMAPLLFPLTWLIGLIEGLQLLGMSQEEFDARYNGLALANQPPLGLPIGEPLRERTSDQWYRRVKPRGPMEAEHVVLAYVRDSGGSVTPAQVALNTQLSLQQATDVLNSLEALGVCLTDYDPSSGLPAYTFPELSRQRLGEPDATRVEQPLDQRLD